MKRIRIIVTVCMAAVLVSFAYTGWAVSTIYDERDARIDAVNHLACAIQVDARGWLKTLATRSGERIPGDDRIADNKVRLAAAAAELNPSCIIPKELR